MPFSLAHFLHFKELPRVKKEKMKISKKTLFVLFTSSRLLFLPITGHADERETAKNNCCHAISKYESVMETYGDDNISLLRKKTARQGVLTFCGMNPEGSDNDKKSYFFRSTSCNGVAQNTVTCDNYNDCMREILNNQ